MAFKQGLDQDSIDFDHTWNNLEAAFKEILTKNASQLSYEELYRYAYRIVLKKKGQELYTKVSDFIKDWLVNNVCGKIRKLLVPSLLTTSADGPTGGSVTERRSAGDRFLHGLKDAWVDHQVCMAMMADVLMYLVSCPKCFICPILAFQMLTHRHRIESTARTIATLLSTTLAWTSSGTMSFSPTANLTRTI